MDERAFAAGQDFLLAAKTFWTTTMYRELRDTAAVRAPQAETMAHVAEVLEKTVLYQSFAWLERHLQRMKYAGRYGLMPYHRERRAALLNTVSGDEAALELDPDLALPAYYTGVDIHQQPGGVWRDDIAALAYERGARSTTPMLGTAHKDLHDRFTDIAVEQGAPEKVLDMGCGFGKSTQPFAQRFPDASIEAVDLSAPCVSLAAHTTQKNQAKNVRFRQMDACATDYDDESFDLVTSTMVIHEMPPKTIDAMLDEAYRVLEPGGRMVHLDFYCLPDAFRQFIYYGHARRNNEPYMPLLAETDLADVLARKGFTDIEIAPFQEASGVDMDANDAWRFPWTVIAATKPAVV
ncbi:MAG: class I SAM-dependent methyltransferase [Rhodospirillaceae bacterium]|nr:class I SAM-dependent methyltransferase [Rhodospirillaceae bacterium]